MNVPILEFFFISIINEFAQIPLLFIQTEKASKAFNCFPIYFHHLLLQSAMVGGILVFASFYYF